MPGLLQLLSPSQRVAFNTGAFYSPNGQRIGLWIRELAPGQLLCCLVDFDRGITGYFPVRLTSALHSPLDLAQHALHMYQWGQYELGCACADRVDIHGELNRVLALGFEAFLRGPETVELKRIASRGVH